MTDAPIDPRLIMQAALDGELDAAGQIAFERQLADDPILAKEYERLATLRHALRTKIGRASAPPALRARLENVARAPARRAPFATRWQVAALAAALAIGVGLGSGTSYLALRSGAPDVVDALVASHRRALLAEVPVDIASNDRHNVRPWFDARIAISPPAPDLAAQGFPLIGGRVDVVDGAPAPTLVYRAREHLLSVTALPIARGLKAGAPAGGYHVLAWQGAGFVFWAVTDADMAELESFAKAFKAEELGGAESR